MTGVGAAASVRGVRMAALRAENAQLRARVAELEAKAFPEIGPIVAELDELDWPPEVNDE